MLQLDRIKRQFGSQVLFEDLSWTLHPRSRVGLVGPNGAGKTTLLRILSGQDEPDAGQVHRPRRLSVGYLPQEVETVESSSVLGAVLGGTPEIARLEAELEALERRLATLGPEDAEVEALTRQYGELRQRFDQLDGDRLEARAQAILSGLGLPESSFHQPLPSLSGGWRMRAVLARLLLGAPGLLLLDEPTNHLDLEAIAWLEEFLATYEGAYVVVSHDRYFLNRVVDEVVELERGRLTTYAGDYDAYVEQKELRERQLEKAAKRQAREIAKVERFIERFRYKNTKARQVQSRIRSLEKLERVQTAQATKAIRFGFPPAPRSGDIAVRAEGVRKQYGDKIVYDGMDLLLRRGERVALVGPNGAGKSTLLKLIAGVTPLDGGRLELGHNVRLHYYAQHQLEALDPEATVLEEAERVAPPEDRTRLRGLLGAFLFHGPDVDKPVAVLSGGEKARLALARMLLQPANLLLLDEPTNHLDLRSCEVLEEALNEYEGTLVLVSHDRYFINRVATSIGDVGGRRVRVDEGDYDSYLEWRRRAAELAVDGVEQETALPSEAATSRREIKRREAEERQRRYRERRQVEARLAPLEAEITALERRVAELTSRQAEPEVYQSPERAREVAREKSEAESLLGRLYTAWEELAEEEGS